MCMFDGNESADNCWLKIRVSRKQRKCDECSRIIGAGERYQNVFLTYTGIASKYYVCDHCSVAADWLAKNCGGVVYGMVWDDFEEHIGGYPRLAFQFLRLKVARERQWKRFDKAGLMALPGPLMTLMEAVGLK